MNTIKFAGEYEISDMRIYSASGNIVDVSVMYQALNIYENMFSNIVTGSILLADTDSLLMNLPITGQEFLSFKITTPGLENVPIDYTKNLMCIYKIDKRVADQGNEVIKLHFCSPEGLRNERTRLSKSYTNTIDKIVENILKDRKALNTNKNIFIEPTAGIKRIISPNKNPYSLIRDLTIDAISKDGSPNFVFYENTSGIHFRTLESIYAKSSIGDYIASDRNFIPMENGVSNIEEDMKRVLDYEIVTNNDTRKHIKSGMLASKTISYNIFNKEVQVESHDYFSDFNKYMRVSGSKSNDNPIYSASFVDDGGNTIGDFKDARIFLHSVSKNSSDKNTEHYDDTNAIYEPNKLGKTISQKFAKNTELEFGVKVNMEINGNTTVNVGSIIDFQMPITGRDHEDDVFDKYHTGKFLITKTRHSFEKLGRRHKIYLSAVKDSYNTKLPKPIQDAAEPRGTKGVKIEI